MPLNRTLTVRLTEQLAQWLGAKGTADRDACRRIVREGIDMGLPGDVSGKPTSRSLFQLQPVSRLRMLPYSIKL